MERPGHTYNTTVERCGAVYNYHLTMEAVNRGSEAHNFEYLVSLLQLSYRKLIGSNVPNATVIAPGG